MNIYNIEFKIEGTNPCHWCYVLADSMPKAIELTADIFPDRTINSMTLIADGTKVPILLGFKRL